MQYALPVFLSYFVLESCLLGIIRVAFNSCNTKKTLNAAPADISRGAPEKEAADGLDWEIFENASKPDYKRNFEFSSEKDIDSLMNKASYGNPGNGYSFLCNALYMRMCLGETFKSLEDKLLRLLSFQFKSGAAPDYINGANFITGAGLGGICIPFAVSCYLNYTGDADILNEIIPYNEDTLLPSGRQADSAFTDTVYSRCLKALNACEAPPEGLICCKETQGCFNFLNAKNRDIAASLLYCFGAESFLPYIEDSKERVTLIGKTVSVNTAAVKAAYSQINIKNPALNFESLISAVLYIVLKGQYYRDEIIKRLSEKVLADNMPEEYCGCKIIQIMLAGIFLKEGIPEAFEAVIKSLNASENFDIIESCLINSLIINCYAGVNFRYGRIKIKPYADKFKFSFMYGKGRILIDYTKNSGGVSVGGLKFNNLDYINLKGYNKDINITFSG